MKIPFLILLLFPVLVYTSCNNNRKIDSKSTTDSLDVKKKDDFKVFWEEFNKAVCSKDTEAVKEYVLDSIYVRSGIIDKSIFVDQMYLTSFVDSIIAKLKSNLDINIDSENLSDHYFTPSLKSLLNTDSNKCYNVGITAQTSTNGEFIMVFLHFVYTKNGFKLYFCEAIPTF